MYTCEQRRRKLVVVSAVTVTSDWESEITTHRNFIYVVRVKLHWNKVTVSMISTDLYIYMKYVRCGRQGYIVSDLINEAGENGF